MDATRSTPFCNYHGRQDCLNPCTATRETSKSSEEDTVKQITLAATFQMIQMMVLNKLMRMGFPEDQIIGPFGCLGIKIKQ